MPDVKTEETSYSLDSYSIEDDEWVDVRDAIKEELVTEPSD